MELLAKQRHRNLIIAVLFRPYACQPEGVYHAGTDNHNPRPARKNGLTAIQNKTIIQEVIIPSVDEFTGKGKYA
jgi:hypothetical protein